MIRWKKVKTRDNRAAFDGSLWANIEQCIYARNRQEIGILAQGSIAPARAKPCSRYSGAGLLFSRWTTRSKKDQIIRQKRIEWLTGK